MRKKEKKKKNKNKKRKLKKSKWEKMMKKTRQMIERNEEQN